MAGDMAALAETQRRRLAGSGLSGIVPRVLAESMGDPELHQDFVDRVVNPFRAMLRLFIERGIERGELRPDLEVEPLVDLLHGDTDLPDPDVARGPGLPRAGSGGLHADPGPRHPQ